MRVKNTLEYLGLWEKLNNPDFKGVEFDPLLAEAGSNAFTMSPSRWVETTGAIGIIIKNGAGGGTYAQRDIAFKFANWVSVEFELYLIKEFQRLKAEEQVQLGWSEKRELSKINYRIHTDAIRQNLIPSEVTPAQASIIYAEEADVLNVTMFGMTARQWREANPDRKGKALFTLLKINAISDHETSEIQTPLNSGPNRKQGNGAETAESHPKRIIFQFSRSVQALYA